MTIEHRQHGTNGGKKANVCMTSCPFCGMKFVEGAGLQRTSHIMHCEQADKARQDNR